MTLTNTNRDPERGCNALNAVLGLNSSRFVHHQVLFKMDKAGDGQLVEFDDLCLNRELSFVGFTPQMFMEVGPDCFIAWHSLADVTGP